MVKKRGSKQDKIKIYAYIKKNLGKGHPLNSIKQHLLMYGYDENFVSRLIRGFYIKQFAKRFSLSFLIVSLISLFFMLPIFDDGITSAVIGISEDIGIGEVSCCIDNSGICHKYYLKSYCDSEGFMGLNHECYDLPYCWGNTLP